MTPKENELFKQNCNLEILIATYKVHYNKEVEIKEELLSALQLSFKIIKSLMARQGVVIPTAEYDIIDKAINKAL